jgi:RND superfamily putative drug exporter
VVVHNPWKVIAGWLLVTIAIVAFAPTLADVTTRDQANFLPDDYESVQAGELAAQSFGRADTASATLVVKRQDSLELSADDQTAITDLGKAIDGAGIERVKQAMTGPQFLSPNKKVQLVTIGLDGTPDEPELVDAVKQLRERATDGLGDTDLEYALTGDVAMFADNASAFDNALLIVGAATIVLIIGLLLLIYRSPVAALLPIVTVGLVSAVAPGLVAWLAQAFGFQVDQSVQIVMTIVLYGVGTDYIVFLLFRYRERLRAGDDPKTALVAAVARVGEVIASAAAAIVIAFMALLLAVFGAFTSFGPGLSIAVVLMAIAAVTLIPAVVSLVGTKVFWPSKSWQRTPKGTVFQRLGTFTGRRPGVVAIASGGVMVVLALGMFGFNTDYDQSGQLPSGTESARGLEYMEGGFPAGALNPTSVFVKSEDGPLDEQALTAYARKLQDVDGVGGVMPGPTGQPATLSEDKSLAKIDLLLDTSAYANSSLDLVDGPLRDVAHAQAPPGTEAKVGGLTSAFADIRDANNRDLWVIFPVAGVLIALVLGLMLRSVVAPLYLMLAVVVGFFSTMGATVLVFQGIADRPGVSFMLPMLVYLFVVAIGTDYNILMIARLREEAKLGHDPRKAANLAVEHGGPSVGAAGVILAGTFASMLLAGVSFLMEMGFAVSVGILIAAFVMSMFLVPSLTALLGHAAWWPGHTDRATTPPPSAEDRDTVTVG